MSIEATKGLQDGPTTEAPITNQRVTARIVREADGTTKTAYRMGGRVYGSLTALKAALEEPR